MVKRRVLSGTTNFNRLTCTRWWILSRPAREYFLTQPGNSQTKGLTPEWVISWAWRWPFVIKRRLHYWHRKGLSPVCVRMWVFRLPVSVNCLRHYSKGHMSSFRSFFGLLTLSMTVHRCKAQFSLNVFFGKAYLQFFCWQTLPCSIVLTVMLSWFDSYEKSKLYFNLILTS